MEQERLAREVADKEQAEKTKKMKESFGDATSQWEKDKSEMQNIALQEKKKQPAEVKGQPKRVKDKGPVRIVQKDSSHREDRR